MVWPCEGGKGSGNVVLRPQQKTSVLYIPQGAQNFHIGASSAAKIVVSLFNRVTMRDLNATTTGSNGAPIMSGDGPLSSEASIAGPTTFEMDAIITSTSQNEETARLFYSYAGLAPCNNDKPIGCSPYHTEQAMQEVMSWSCWAQKVYGSSEKAWADLVTGAYGPAVTTVSWYKFGLVWSKWSNASSSLSWQFAFDTIDTDSDQQVTFDEFSTSFSVCHGLGAAGGSPFSSFILSWFLIIALIMFTLCVLVPGLRQCISDRQNRDLSIQAELVSSTHKGDMEQGRTYNIAEAPLLVPANHTAFGLETVSGHGAAVSTASPIEGVWTSLPPSKRSRGCTDACGGDGGGLLECMGLRSTAVHTWACPCNTAHSERTQSCKVCGATRPTSTQSPVMVPDRSQGPGVMEPILVRVPMDSQYDAYESGPPASMQDYRGDQRQATVHSAHETQEYQEYEREPSDYYEEYSPMPSPNAEDEVDATIQTMIRSADAVDVQEDGCEFLKNACMTEGGLEKTERHGGIKVIIDSMQAHPESAQLQDHAIGALVRLVHSRSSEVSHQGGIESIIKAMRRHPANEQVQEKACEALQQLSMTPEDRARVVDSGGIELIEQAMLAHHEVAGVQECSCLAMGNLAFEAEGRELIAKYGGIRAIISAMTEHLQDRGVQEAACFVLHNMACTPEYTRKIADLGGVQAIREAQRVHHTLQTQEEAVAALEILLSA